MEKTPEKISDLTIGERIHLLIRKQYRSQSSFARALEKPKVQVHMWVTGKSYPSVESIKQIAELTGVSTDWLLTGKNPETVEIN